MNDKHKQEAAVAVLDAAEICLKGETRQLIKENPTLVLSLLHGVSLVISEESGTITKTGDMTLLKRALEVFGAVSEFSYELILSDEDRLRVIQGMELQRQTLELVKIAEQKRQRIIEMERKITNAHD